MRAIFISYRREDAEGQAGRLFNDLAEQFGEHSVFMDVAGIEPGRDFRRAIDEQVASCGVLLALIGKSWLDAKDESGRRRLDDPMDFVRLETASAMKREIPVIPVLVQGASMPRADQLPPDLAELAYRNGVELTHARWDSDVQVLIKALRPHMELPPQSAKKSWRLIIAMSVAAIAVAIAIGGYVVYQKAANRQLALVNAKTGKCLTIAGGVSTGNNIEAVQFDCDSDPSRRWTLRKMADSGVYQIRNVQTGKCLTIAGGVSTDNNVTALQFDCDTDLSRRWTIRLK